MEPTNFRRVMSLDIATATAIQDDRNGLADSTRVLRHGDVENPMYDMLTQVPDHYHVMDVRKPAGKYVNDKMLMLIDELFEIRGELEKNMNRRELASFDKVFAKYLQKEQLMPRLTLSVHEDYHLANVGRAKTADNEYPQNINKDIQLMK